jgi:hypothetical protein
MKGEINMNCNTIYCSSATTTDTTIVLVPNRTIQTLTNTGCYKLIICCSATAESNLPVFIQVGTTNIPVLCKYGNEVYANQLNRRTCYRIGYGDLNTSYADGQFVIQSPVGQRGADI